MCEDLIVEEPTDTFVMVLQDAYTTISIRPLGAELTSLVASGVDWLWRGDERSWPRTAPILFPFVGGCADFALHHLGKSYPAPKSHGFAPDSFFSVLSRDGNQCSMQLRSDECTRLTYPFEFVLDVCFVLQAGRVEQTARVTNVGHDVMPASLGFHPGFQWPLPSRTLEDRSAKDRHVVIFQHDEFAPVRRPVDRLLFKESEPSPVINRRLPLSDDLFDKGAIVFDQLRSQSVWYGVPGRQGVRVDFDTPHLGLWMIPGAKFLCIEPWQGHACPEGFAGEILDKPGMIHLNPGESFFRQMVITVNASDSEFT